MTSIWRNYEQAALDAQYGTRAQLGDGFDAWQDACRAASADARRRLHPQIDVSYGPGPRQVLDIFPAPDGKPRAPVVIFIHGGFWRARDKSDYGFLADGLRSLGAMPFMINYPLAPAARLEEIVASARGAVQWIIDHAARFGGDPDNIWLFGHSAGAHLAAMCCCHDAGGGRDFGSAIKGAVLTSGLYELEPVRLCFANADLGLDEAQVARLSPCRLRACVAGPLFVVSGGRETAEFAAQAEDFVAAMRAQQVETHQIGVAGANHYTMLDQIARPGSEILALVEKRIGR
jgi:arylformamidase